MKGRGVGRQRKLELAWKPQLGAKLLLLPPGRLETVGEASQNSPKSPPPHPYPLSGTLLFYEPQP